MSRSSEEFTEFVRSTGPQLTRYAFLLTGDWYLAEDLAQVTYAKVYASWRRVKDEPYGYARKTLLRSYLSHRRLRRNGEHPVDQAVDASAIHVTDHTIRLDVIAAIATLGPVDRAVVVLRYWEDRSVAQTAVDLNLSEANVRTRSRRALARLRPLLTPAESSSDGSTPTICGQEARRS